MFKSQLIIILLTHYHTGNKNMFLSLWFNLNMIHTLMYIHIILSFGIMYIHFMDNKDVDMSSQTSRTLTYIINILLVCRPFTRSSVCMSLCPPVHSSFRSFIDGVARLSVRLSVLFSVYLSVCLSHLYETYTMLII